MSALDDLIQKMKGNPGFTKIGDTEIYCVNNRVLETYSQKVFNEAIEQAALVCDSNQLYMTALEIRDLKQDKNK